MFQEQSFSDTNADIQSLCRRTTITVITHYKKTAEMLNDMCEHNTSVLTGSL